MSNMNIASDAQIIEAWISQFVWEIVHADNIDMIDPNNFHVWGQLTPEQQGYAFHYLLGVYADAIGEIKEQGEEEY